MVRPGCTGIFHIMGWTNICYLLTSAAEQNLKEWEGDKLQLQYVERKINRFFKSTFIFMNFNHALKQQPESP